MFASDQASSNASVPMTLTIRRGGPSVSSEHPRTPKHASATLTPSWHSHKQPIGLRPCADEPALGYGCVDWFLYDKQ